MSAHGRQIQKISEAIAESCFCGGICKVNALTLHDDEQAPFKLNVGHAGENDQAISILGGRSSIRFIVLILNAIAQEQIGPLAQRMGSADRCILWSGQISLPW